MPHNIWLAGSQGRREHVRSWQYAFSAYRNAQKNCLRKMPHACGERTAALRGVEIRCLFRVSFGSTQGRGGVQERMRFLSYDRELGEVSLHIEVRSQQNELSAVGQAFDGSVPELPQGRGF